MTNVTPKMVYSAFDAYEDNRKAGDFNAIRAALISAEHSAWRKVSEADKYSEKFVIVTVKSKPGKANTVIMLERTIANNPEDFSNSWFCPMPVHPNDL